jgi:hypothetical protein
MKKTFGTTSATIVGVVILLAGSAAFHRAEVARNVPILRHPHPPSVVVDIEELVWGHGGGAPIQDSEKPGNRREWIFVSDGVSSQIWCTATPGFRSRITDSQTVKISESDQVAEYWDRTLSPLYPSVLEVLLDCEGLEPQVLSQDLSSEIRFASDFKIDLEPNGGKASYLPAHALPGWRRVVAWRSANFAELVSYAEMIPQKSATSKIVERVYEVHVLERKEFQGRRVPAVVEACTWDRTDGVLGPLLSRVRYSVMSLRTYDPHNDGSLLWWDGPGEGWTVQFPSLTLGYSVGSTDFSVADIRYRSPTRFAKGLPSPLPELLEHSDAITPRLNASRDPGPRPTSR